MHNWLQKAIISPTEIVKKIIPDEQSQIENQLIEWVEIKKYHLILTSGGTGPTARDVTPEATLAIADKVLDGFGEKMRSISLKYVPTAILSRQVAVIKKNTLIINLPGRPSSIQETLNDLFEAVPYCLELLQSPRIETNPEVISAFFPKNK